MIFQWFLQLQKMQILTIIFAGYDNFHGNAVIVYCFVCARHSVKRKQDKSPDCLQFDDLCLQPVVALLQ